MKPNRALMIPALISAGSLCFLAGLTLFTSPYENITYVIIFLAATAIFLPSTLFLILKIRRGQVGHKAKYRIFILTIFILLVLMFRSSRSLNLTDLLIIIAVIGGMLFYSGRRLE